MTGGDPGFWRAVDVARQNIPIKKSVTKPEYWCGYTIVRQDERFAVYNADTWQEPKEKPLLPWSAPEGIPAAHVDMSGNVTIYPEIDNL